MKRYFRTPDNIWAEGWGQRKGLPFADDGLDHAAAMAAVFGVPALVPVDVADSDPDPRTGPLLAEPPAPPRPKTPDETFIEGINAATTLGDLKAALVRRFAP